MDYQGPTAAVRATAAAAATVPASVGSSRLAQMQMRFQQRQQQERDQRKIEQIATRTTASTATIAASSSNGRITSTTTNVTTVTATTATTANSSATSGGGGGAVELADRLNATTLSSSLGAGKVRQMFDDRRHGRVAGIDKSYPLQPIQTKTGAATGAATAAAGITNGNHSTGGGGGSNNNNPTGGGAGDGGRDGSLGRSVVTKGATGMNNKPRVPPISATSRNRLVQQQANRAHGLRQDVVVSGMQQQQSTRSTSNAGETTTDGFDDNDNFLELEKHPDIAFDLDGDSVHAAANHVNNNLGGDYSHSSSAARTATNVNSLKLKPVPGRSAASTTATPARNSSLKKQASSITSNGSITSTATLPRSVNGSAKLGIQRTAPGSKSNGPSRGVSQPSPASSAGSLRRISSTPAPTTGTAMHATTAPHHNDDLVPDGLTRCEICSRNFADDRIEKHRQICQKTKAKKRKVFDVTKHRVQGTDAESYVLVKGKKGGATGPPRKQSSQLNGTGGTQAGTGADKQSSWRKKHEEFIATIRAAKELKAHLAKGGKLSDLPPPPPAENPDYVQCPHCSRRFNQTAADRHIPKCATMLHNKPKPKPKAAASTLRRY